MDATAVGNEGFVGFFFDEDEIVPRKTKGDYTFGETIEELKKNPKV